MEEQAIRKERLEERVQTRIREAIVSGDLKSGEWINQDELAQSLNVSRMPIRSALARLEEQRFVTAYPHRGVVVAPISLEDVEETYLIRVELESLAARLATPNMTKGLIAELDTTLHDAQRAIKEGDETLLFEQNRKFHRLGYRASDRRRLCQLIEEFRDHSERYRRLHATLLERSREAYEEHRKILTAWRDGNAEEAAQWVRENLQQSREAIIDALQLNTDKQAEPSSWTGQAAFGYFGGREGGASEHHRNP